MRCRLEPSGPKSLALIRAVRAVRAALTAATLVLAGCAAGPNFKPPAPPTVDGYVAQQPKTTAATPGVAGGAAQHFAAGAQIHRDWWTLFHSARLDALIDAALARNPDLQAARAALQVAEEDALAQRGAFLPQVAAGFNATHQQASNVLAPVPNYPTVPEQFLYSLFTPQVSISYAPDLFGLNRRTMESLQAQAEGARFQMIAAWTTLTSNVVVAAVQEASLRDQLAATRKLVALEERSVAILRLRLRKGDASRLDVAAQRAQLAQVQAGLPVLVKQLAQARDALAVLTGRFPDRQPSAAFTLADLTLPQDLPLSLPSQLIAQRPDVRQARADLHAASAQIGIAAAERLPNIDLTASAGSTALAISKVFASGTGFWGLAASLTAPIFDGGELRHLERAAKASYVEAAQEYRGTVLGAFQNVADTLAALQQDARTLQATATEERATRTTLELTQLQLRRGYVGMFELLNAEQSYEQARIALVQAQASRFTDTAALYEALGGGWWHHKILSER